MSEQAYKTPLVDLLRNVPQSHRTEWAIQWSEDGRETGHAMCPIGKLAHEAADRIAELEAAQAQAVNQQLLEALQSQRVYVWAEGYENKIVVDPDDNGDFVYYDAVVAAIAAAQQRHGAQEE